MQHYILRNIAIKPSHGYEILQDIDSKTDGAWRPGAGSVYPILKRLLASGYIKADERKRLATARRVYRITPKGLKELKDHEAMFSGSGQRWMSMRRLFFELIEPNRLTGFFVDGSKIQFEIAKELLESKKNTLSPSETEFLLREYALNLERQLDWANKMLSELKSTRLVAAKAE